MNTIFCLVSRQAMANVLPVMMYKPKNVFLFATPEEKDCANNLEQLFKSKKINVIRKDGLNAYDYFAFKKCVIENLDNIKDEVWLNVTGGTKLMALAAYEAFAEKNKKIIYCNTNGHEIIHLFPSLSIEKIELSMKINDYLSAYGYRISETKDYSKEIGVKGFIDFIFPDKLESFISIASRIRKDIKLDVPHVTRRFGDYQIQKIFNMLRVKHFPTDTIIKVAANFFHGYWFEAVVEKIIYNYISQELITGVKIISPGGNENEIDVLFLKNNQLYLVSCKSGNIERKGMKEHLAELDVLRNLTGGTFGKALFIYPDTIPENLLIRAKEFKIIPFPITKLKEYFENI